MDNDFIDQLEESRNQRKALQNKREQLDELTRMLVERQKQIEAALERVRIMKAIMDASSGPVPGTRRNRHSHFEPASERQSRKDPGAEQAGGMSNRPHNLAEPHTIISPPSD